MPKPLSNTLRTIIALAESAQQDFAMEDNIESGWEAVGYLDQAINEITKRRKAWLDDLKIVTVE